MFPDKEPNSSGRGVEISQADVCMENDIFVYRGASLKNAYTEWSPRDEWMELGGRQDSSAISEKFGSGSSDVFQRRTETRAGGDAALLEM